MTTGVEFQLQNEIFLGAHQLIVMRLEVRIKELLCVQARMSAPTISKKEFHAVTVGMLVGACLRTLFTRVCVGAF